MRRYERSVAPTTLQITEGPVPALVYFIPQNGGRGAAYSQFRLTVEAIEQNTLYEPNWDGYGALPIDKDIKQNAIEGIKSVLLQAPTPEVSPNPNGTLSFEWRTENGRAHLEIGRTKFSFYVSPRTGSAVLLDGPVSEINQFHGSLIARLLFPKDVGAPAISPMWYSTNV